MVDVGCGAGAYASSWAQGGAFSRVSCFDGNPYTPQVTEGLCTHYDLASGEGELPRGSFDWVVSLEVAEHIPSKFTARYLRTLKALGIRVGLILTWAQPGQGGEGHVNELPRPQVLALLRTHFPELLHCPRCESELRSGALHPWFKGEGVYVLRRNSTRV